MSIEDITAQDFCSEIEKYGTLFAWSRDQNRNPILRPDALMAEREAKIIMAARERLQLPPLSMIHRCPLLTERDGKPVVLGHGYHRELGGRYVTSDVEVPTMSLEEAIERLLALIEEFPFATRADKSRAMIAIITPALRFGGLLRCHFPAVLVEADRPQAGKGTLVEAIQRFYGELCELTGKRKGGVGSFDEDLSRQLLRGRSFIQIDNIRDAMDSEFLETLMTCPFGATISARIPYKPSISVDPNRHIFHLTSNQFEATQDLAARACVIRLLKRDGYMEEIRRWPRVARTPGSKSRNCYLDNLFHRFAMGCQRETAKRKRTPRRRTLPRVLAGRRLVRTQRVRFAVTPGWPRKNPAPRRQRRANMGARNGQSVESPGSSAQNYPPRNSSSSSTRQTKAMATIVGIAAEKPTTQTRRSASESSCRSSSKLARKSRSMSTKSRESSVRKRRPEHYDSYVRKSYVFKLIGGQ